MLILDDETIEQLKVNGMPHEQEIVVRHFMYFGPLPSGLLKLVDDRKWTMLSLAASEIAETEAAEDPDCKFERWPVDYAPYLTPEANMQLSHRHLGRLPSDGPPPPHAYIKRVMYEVPEASLRKMGMCIYMPFLFVSSAFGVPLKGPSIFALASLHQRNWQCISPTHNLQKYTSPSVAFENNRNIVYR